MNKKLLVVIVVAIILVGGIIIQRNSAARNNAVKIETARVTRKDLSETVASSGKTKATELVDLHFQAGGRLAWVGVKEGDVVSTGQTLASLDAQELKKNLDKALRDYSKERNDFEEDQHITYNGQLFTDTVKRILEKNQWDLEKAVMDVELKDIALKWSYLISPIAGVVTNITNPIAGVNVLVTDTFTVANPDSLVFTANVDEVDVGKIQLGQAAEIRLDAHPDKVFKGVVSKIAFAAEISAGGATVYPVEIKFSDLIELRLGLNGDVSIVTKETRNAVSIPAEALKENEQKYVIQKISQNYQKTVIKIGTNGENDLEVQEGLSVGDEVVVKGFQFLPKNLQTP